MKTEGKRIMKTEGKRNLLRQPDEIKIYPIKWTR